ncbi:hypothetical protein F4810DRAFT_157172 [Camillea tinctor]|nr:hypothetical protein F4810DRAFT_157172 [Camillea tinctor]
MNREARFACNACRRLKRKCPRELPSCTLCIRLEKRCEYPARALGSQRQSNERAVASDPVALNPDNQQSGSRSTSSSSSETLLTGPPPIPASDFPVMYFLDSETCVEPLTPAEPLIAATSASSQLTPEAQGLFDAYFATVHPWLPILSKKRIQRVLLADSSSLSTPLLQCMALLASPSLVSEDAYHSARDALARAETTELPSLSHLQAAILLCTYEIGHALYPSAYLRAGHAARVAVMMGLHDRRHAAQLFGGTRTWTGREEERRAWWAVFCLDRFVSQGVEGLGLAPGAPEPSPGELLPAHKAAWDAGAVGFNEPLFAASFSTSTTLGAFANTCQAALVLGRVLRHRDEARLGGGLAPRFRMAEARQLHGILVALGTHLGGDGEGVLADQGTWVALAMCWSARLILYNMYACNERYSADHERSTEEAEMQKLTLGGIIEVAQATGRFARQVLDLMDDANAYDEHTEGSSYYGGIIPSPLVANTLYAAATECEWFILEQQDSDAAVSLREIVQLLQVTAERWQVAGIYLSQIYKWPGYNSMVS